MSQPFTVRLAKPEDVSQVLALQESITEAPHWNAAVYREFVEHPLDAIQRKALLIATNAERLYGFAAATALGPEAELESIAVAADSRRLGLGSALLDAVRRWAAAEGAEALRLEVRGANAAARTFYERKGFQQVGLRRGYYRQPDDDGVLMLLELAASRSLNP